MNYQQFVEQNKDEMIIALQRAVRINSERGESFLSKEGQTYPFGQGIQDALEYFLELGKNMGFEVKNVDNQAGHIDFRGTGDGLVGILGHIDVVPAGGDWKTDPFGGEIIDEKIYGRGTTDDKGPVIACLYAMKALKDAGYVPNATIRLILGLDEETGNWTGLEHYFTKERRPDFGFTPDGEFPLINGEKGTLVFDVVKKFSKNNVKGLELRSLKGGMAPNSVADNARAVVNSPDPSIYDILKEKITAYRSLTGYKINYKGIGKSLEITVSGVSAHGAKPEAGLNAISIMMELLAQFNFANEDTNDFIAFYNKYIGFCLDGEKLGIAMEDQKSGHLVFNVGMAEVSKDAAKLVLNLRYPVTYTSEDVFAPMMEILTKYNMGLVKKAIKEPVYFELDSRMVQDLWDIYKEHTGDIESQPMVMGGGTYAKATPGIIAYGALFPGDEDLMHQKDECIEISRFLQTAKIYADAIYKLSSENYEN